MAKTKSDNQDKLLLAASISSAKPSEIREKIADGADVNCTNKFGMTPLMLSAQYNKCIAVTKALIEAGADINAVEPRYKSNAFHLAAQGSSNPRIVETLLNAGANPEAKNYLGETPLILAMSNPEASIARALIKHGADVNATDYQGHSVLYFAEKEKRNNLAKLLKEAGAK